MFSGLIGAMLDAIAPVLTSKCGLDPKRLTLVGVSGGPDSLCLLEVLREAGFRVAAAHFNHHLRPEADSDAEAVARIAARLSIDCVLGGADVKSEAQARRLSIEAAGRDLRYQFLFSEARARGAQAVAVGHTADDQAETILMHLVRGSGMRGLVGMSYQTVLRAYDPVIPLVRPLLGIRHAEAEAYCGERGLTALNDTSNTSDDYLRNRVRHQLLPLLDSFNPAFRDTLLRNSSALASDWSLLDELVSSRWAEILLLDGAGYFAFDRVGLEASSPALQRRLIRRAAEALLPAEQIDFQLADLGVDFLRGSGLSLDLGAGLRLSRESALVYLAVRDASLPSAAWPQMPAGLDTLRIRPPGAVALADGWSFESEVGLAPSVDPRRQTEEDDAFCASIDALELPEELELTLRRPGDRIEPLGMGGQSQKLSDLFVNAKVPARARARWPVLCAADKIVWVPGLRLAESFKIKPSTRRVARFLVKPPGAG